MKKIIEIIFTYICMNVYPFSVDQMQFYNFAKALNKFSMFEEQFNVRKN